VTLFSDPEMSDAEKLSWIVMGRDTASGGAEAALLQQAALALLSGGGTSENFAGRVGLDEIGFKGASTDSTDANAAALTLGKRLSKDLYVTYEQSLNGAMGTLYVFYEMSCRPHAARPDRPADRRGPDLYRAQGLKAAAGR
jgi:translocation and assembly module TamB